VGLVPPGWGQQAADAYRRLRRLQHRARLDEAPTQVDPATVVDDTTAILRVWHHVLGGAPASV
jgi:glutamate-ammonia-ligase adenylyltransferase